MNYDKCKFFKQSLDYLGHVISNKGVAPSQKKMAALVNAPPPTDLTTLKSFIGLLNFYAKFIPNLQSLLTPLHNLTQKETKFIWSKECQEVFEKSKKLVAASPVLAHFDPSKPIVIVCDASPYGVGAVLNIVLNGVEKPVYMVSSTLSKAEKNYAQLHREALAIVFAVRKFHKYIFGYQVTIYTDCKALESILSSKKDLGTVVNSRFLRWMIFLQNYDIVIKFRPSSQTANADALSRLPIQKGTKDEVGSIKAFNSIFILNDVPTQLITLESVRKETQNCNSCKKLVDYVRNGWPNKDKIPEGLKIYFKFRNSLDLEDGCIFYGERLFVPCSLREKMLTCLHKEHIGIVKCKQLARNTVWWPKLDDHIEEFINRCRPCQMSASKRTSTPLMSWKSTTYPFERVHADHFFINGKCFFVIVDDYSQWLDVYPNRSPDSDWVISSLRSFCAAYGLPHTLVTDNATAFTSNKFQVFCKSNNIQHLKSPPFHPQSNGLAERAVGIVKSSLQKFKLENKSQSMSIEEKIKLFLFKYRNTPLTNCKSSPSELIYKFTPRNSFVQLQKRKSETVEQSPACEVNDTSRKKDEESESQLIPLSSNSTQQPRTCSSKKLVTPKKVINYKNRSNKSNIQEQQKKMIKQYKAGDLVYFYSNRSKNWTKAKIILRISPLVYKIEIAVSGLVTTSHLENLKDFKEENNIRVEHELTEETETSVRRTRGERLRAIPRIEYGKYFFSS